MYLITWPGGEHPMKLALGQLRALQANCEAGPEEICTRMMLRNWRVDDVVESLRLGLIGGGMAAEEAGPMVTRLMDQHPPGDFVGPALEALSRSLFGDALEDDAPEKPAAGERTSPENGPSPASTETGR